MLKEWFVRVARQKTIVRQLGAQISFFLALKPLKERETETEKERVAFKQKICRRRWTAAKNSLDAAWWGSSWCAALSASPLVTV